MIVHQAECDCGDMKVTAISYMYWTWTERLDKTKSTVETTGHTDPCGLSVACEKCGEVFVLRPEGSIMGKEDN